MHYLQTATAPYYLNWIQGLLMQENLNNKQTEITNAGTPGTSSNIAVNFKKQCASKEHERCINPITLIFA